MAVCFLVYCMGLIDAMGWIFFQWALLYVEPMCIISLYDGLSNNRLAEKEKSNVLS